MLVNYPVVGMKYHEISWTIINMPCFMLIIPHVSSKSCPTTSLRFLWSSPLLVVETSSMYWFPGWNGQPLEGPSPPPRRGTAFDAWSPAGTARSRCRAPNPWCHRAGRVVEGPWIFGGRNGQKREKQIGTLYIKKLGNQNHIISWKNARLEPMLYFHDHWQIYFLLARYWRK